MIFSACPRESKLWFCTNKFWKGLSKFFVLSPSHS